MESNNCEKEKVSSLSERLCCEGLLSIQDSIDIVSEVMTDRLNESIDDTRCE